MANSRIKDIATTAAAAASDDYLVIDGATNGTRKIAASNIGGYDFTSTLTPSIDSRGVSSSLFAVYPTNANDMAILNTMKVKAYLIDTYDVCYPLTVSYFSFVPSLGYIKIGLKSHYGNPQNTSSSTISGTLHIVAPFEISNVTTSK